MALALILVLWPAFEELYEDVRSWVFIFQLPDLKDAAAVQKFFLDEIQLGEELLAQGEMCVFFTRFLGLLCMPWSVKAQMCSSGDYEKGVDHLTNAIAVCGQPQQLLQVLQQTLPPPVFQMLLIKLPTISQVSSTCVSYHHCILLNPPRAACSFWDKYEC